MANICYENSQKKAVMAILMSAMYNIIIYHSKQIILLELYKNVHFKMIKMG